MPKQGQKAPKGLPKRVGNQNAKARRARSWERGQARKAERREANHARHLANRKRALSGELSPYQVRRAARPTGTQKPRSASHPDYTCGGNGGNFAFRLWLPFEISERSGSHRPLPAVGAAMLRHARSIVDNGHTLPFHYRYSNLSRVV